MHCVFVLNIIPRTTSRLSYMFAIEKYTTSHSSKTLISR